MFLRTTLTEHPEVILSCTPVVLVTRVFPRELSVIGQLLDVKCVVLQTFLIQSFLTNVCASSNCVFNMRRVTPVHTHAPHHLSESYEQDF